MVWYGMVKMAKKANFWTDGPFLFIFFSRLSARQVWYGWVGYGMVKIAKNINFWTNGPFSVIFFSTLLAGPN